MSHSTQLLSKQPWTEDPSARPTKRQKTIDDDVSRATRSEHEHVIEGTSCASVPPHPLHIKPLGNFYDTSEANIKSRSGGFANLPDELLIQVLEWLDGSTLKKLGSTCRALYAFCRADELWKALFIEYVMKSEVQPICRSSP